MLFRCLPGVAAHLEKQKFPHEWTNMTVVPAPPDSCGVFADFTCATHYQLHLSPFSLLIKLLDSDQSNFQLAVVGNHSPSSYFPCVTSLLVCACRYRLSSIAVNRWPSLPPHSLSTQWSLAHWRDIPNTPQGLASQWS